MPKLPSVTTITSGYTSAQALNDNFEALKDAFSNTVSRDGYSIKIVGTKRSWVKLA